jgi:DNA-binding PadR family transcriptional regulator
MTVLLMLVGGPVHPYELQRRMKHWGKDRVVNVGQRATLYKTIERLHRAGLIAVRGTERDQRFPERTLYALTERGRRVGREWLHEMLATAPNEFPRFPAALSFLMLFTPQEAATVLEKRLAAVRANLAEIERDLEFTQDGRTPPRVALIEDEYLRAVTAAEVNWLESVLDDLRSGALTWSHEELAATALTFLPE